MCMDRGFQLSLVFFIHKEEGFLRNTQFDQGRHGMNRGGGNAEIIMIGGYYLYDSILTANFIVPLAGIAGNSVQGLFGLVASVAIFRILSKTRLNDKI